MNRRLGGREVGWHLYEVRSQDTLPAGARYLVDFSRGAFRMGITSPRESRSAGSASGPREWAAPELVGARSLADPAGRCRVGAGLGRCDTPVVGSFAIFGRRAINGCRPRTYSGLSPGRSMKRVERSRRQRVHSCLETLRREARSNATRGTPLPTRDSMIRVRRYIRWSRGRDTHPLGWVDAARFPHAPHRRRTWSHEST